MGVGAVQARSRSRSRSRRRDRSKRDRGRLGVDTGTIRVVVGHGLASIVRRGTGTRSKVSRVGNRSNTGVVGLARANGKVRLKRLRGVVRGVVAAHNKVGLVLVSVGSRGRSNVGVTRAHRKVRRKVRRMGGLLVAAVAARR